MKTWSTLLILISTFVVSACGKPSSGDDETPSSRITNGKTLPTISGDNVLTMDVSTGGGNCGSSTDYINKPCVSVTICNADGSHCSPINDLLVDTGSFGLRVFKSVLDSNGITPIQVTTSGGNLAECVEYGDGSKHWGPVAQAQVKLGNESAVTVPIQVIDSSYVDNGTDADCTGGETGPGTGSGQGAFNGILGVGPYAQDCGAGCAVNAGNGNYYSCTGTGCSSSTAALAKQVTNPVSALTTDGNGVILMLPDLDFGGNTAASGYLVLGIGTRSNNTLTNVTAYPMDASNMTFTTSYNGHDYPGFLDSGSNGLFFPDTNSSVSGCSGILAGWYCPSSTQNLSAVNTAYNSTTHGSVSFQIENFNTFWNSPNWVAKEIGGASGGLLNGQFDWGLSFFFGRNVAVGIEGKSSSLGSGTYWAY